MLPYAGFPFAYYLYNNDGFIHIPESEREVIPGKTEAVKLQEFCNLFFGGYSQ